MKKWKVFFMLAAIVLALAASGCKTEGDSGGPVTYTYKGETSDGAIIALVITEGRYEFSEDGKISRGTAEKSLTNTNVWILTPDKAPTTSFNVTVKGQGIDGLIKGTITYDDGSTKEGEELGEIDPIIPPPPPKNTLTITGITGRTGEASVALMDDSGNIEIGNDDGIITNGSMYLPLYTWDEDTDEVLAWGGSGSFYILLRFYDSREDFIYTGGGTTRQKYNFSAGATTIPFNQFAPAPPYELTITSPEPVPSGLTIKIMWLLIGARFNWSNEPPTIDSLSYHRGINGQGIISDNSSVLQLYNPDGTPVGPGYGPGMGALDSFPLTVVYIEGIDQAFVYNGVTAINFPETLQQSPQEWNSIQGSPRYNFTYPGSQLALTMQEFQPLPSYLYDVVIDAMSANN